MKRSIGLICAILLLAAGQVFASQVTNVELTWQDGFTVARVDVDGTVRFSHQTEVAKDGKPFRVIVDLLTATHQLGQKTFNDLPSCPIKSIRTSQYSVQPEKVVRIVFDMKDESVYRIDAGENWVKVFFPDKDGVSFPVWSTSKAANHPKSADKPAVAASPESTPKQTAPSRKSASQLNQTINEDRLASLEPEKNKTAAPPSPKAPSRAVPHVTEPAANAGSASAEHSKPATDKAKSAKTVASENPSPHPTHVASVPDAKPQEPAEKATARPSRPANSEPAPKAVKKTESVSKKSGPTVAKADKDDKAAAGNDNKVDNKQTSKTSTSRFRRSPAPDKFKGTLVAEFPKRLVIKYKSHSRRDPFETLINETKQYNNPVERRIPIVEGLRLVGVIESDEIGNSALFEDKDGYGYILKEGDKVYNGYVLRIAPDRVYFQIFEYGWSRTVALNLEKNR